jgi:2-desacetyl-2-hydroxyethyl bacteriochlorophyllide A dehydrogenase
MDKRIGFNRILGHEMSGTVAALGHGVDGFSIGQPVTVRPLRSCGRCPACMRGLSHICHRLQFLGLDSDGALQEYWNVEAELVHHLPDGMSLEHAALAEPVAVACHDVRMGRVEAGEDVLVIGGGPIGILIGMVCQHVGARVTISEVNECRLALAKRLGFQTVNPKIADLAREIMEQTNDKGADVIFEVSGTRAGASVMTEVAASRGRIVMVAIHTTKPEVDLFRFFWRELELIGVRVYERQDFDQAIGLLAEGAIDVKEIITDVSRLEDIGTAFASLDGNATAMKSLIEIQTSV